jgi:hypothetical protein
LWFWHTYQAKQQQHWGKTYDNRNHTIIKKLMDVIPICSVGSMFYKQMFVLKDLLVVR